MHCCFRSSPKDTKMAESRSIVLNNFGGYHNMTVAQVEFPKTPNDGVIVKMKACGLNFSDIICRMGLFTLHNVKPPFVMGSEGAGSVVAVADDVKALKVGDRVMCWNFTYGMWSEYVSVPSNQCYLLPETMTFEEAAAMPINYVTAHLAIAGFGGLASGHKVLIQSAAGGVGWAATQIARNVDNVTVFGTASASKHALIVENGITHPIDYRNSDFVEEVLRISPTGVDIILDCLSGYDFVRSRQILKHMGKLIHIGISNMVEGENRSVLRMLKVWWQLKNISMRDLIEKNHAICGMNIASMQKEQPDTFLHAMEEVIKLYNMGKVKPRIDSVWSFSQVAKAMEHMVNRKNIGKIILVPDESGKENKA